ncbi:MAG: LLM class F420-dependent oxidoreductase [Acidimicrobiales bacterium]|nr:LLM class F420-dependent oxidoreductase [Acidimicrobiales bacterium]
MRMRIGIFAGDVTGNGSVDAIISAAQVAAEQGFPSLWLPQIFGADAITVAAVIGREVPGIELGTAVVPTYPRHPMMLAQQALTANVITGGRFTLGIGLSHQIVIEQMFKQSFDKPLRHMREYLSVLRPLIHEKSVAFSGETLGAQSQIDVPGAEPCPILIAALGPKMLELAGQMAEGTITWMTGPKTLANHTIPTIAGSAEAAGRAKPRIVVGVPVCVTDDVEGVRARAAQALVAYGFLPSYRAMLDREGLEGPADFAVIGDEDTVRAGLKEYAAVGVDDLLAAELAVTSDERQRTRDLLRTLL